MPMNIVSEIWTWQQGDRLYSRLTTNACAKRFLARLTSLDLLESAETIHAYFGDRVYGGNGYEILWKRHVTWDQLGNVLTNV
jgi:hypothetical protein